jgi:predicted short-subunit dehydrogenase-like oxidoreductase (DUF2520 family)
MPEPAIGFIGAGILGKGMALALSARGYRVAAVSSRTLASAEDLASRIPGCRAAQDGQEVAESCRLVFITTPDDVMGAVAAAVRWRQGQGVVHCNGTHSPQVLDAATRWGALVGSFHPFQTFAGLADPEEAAARLEGVTFSLEAGSWLRDTLEEMAVRLGGRAVSIKPEDRPLYHTSAVFSSGYLVALIKTSADIWEVLGVSQEEALATILPLARAALSALETSGIRDGVTGPLVRGDVGTVRRHMESLRTRLPHLLPLYCALSRESLPLAEQRVGREKRRAMERLVEEYEDLLPPAGRGPDRQEAPP